MEQPSRGRPDPPVVVIGGGLAGLATAARLAKQRFTVQLFEARDRLGGDWAPRQLGSITVDDAPAVIGLPAPWRDLFRKSGRPLETELSRCGRALEPAPAPMYVFADGVTLTLPTDRGEQYDALAAAYGAPVATTWRDLLDGLDATWQALRPLGLETELSDRRHAARAARQLRPKGTVADLAKQAPHPHLAAVIRSVAWRQGSAPERTPAWCAVDLVIARTFGRWSIDNGRTSVLVDALTERLQLRKVTVHLNTEIDRILLTDGRVTGVRTASGRSIAAAAVVCTADPWQLTDRLVPQPELGRLRRDLRGLAPAHAPLVRHERTGSTGPIQETIALDGSGVPVITYVRPGLRTTHDFTTAGPEPAWGPAWTRRSDLARRATTTTDVAGLFIAGAATVAGSGPPQVVQSGALASAACADYAERSGFRDKERLLESRPRPSGPRRSSHA
ncbi:phytoene desaturase family protein [Microlunatus ginsengisoli]|uniref:4,4'-diaponeurosporene oxygenase n=1 Tax=Microlunatus ginsengisoli TaxID=363863 RepID=A0ABP7ABD0_9ACTN